MPEIEEEVKTYKVIYICDECFEGEMEWNGIGLTTYPMQYPHKCNKCGALKTFRDRHYPLLRKEGLE